MSIPSLFPYLNATYPGFWSDPEERGAGQATGDHDGPMRRRVVEIWAKLQELIYTDMPYIKFGTEASFRGRRAKGVTGIAPRGRRTRPLFFNVAPPAEVR